MSLYLMPHQTFLRRCRPVLLERGQPVEARGGDIGKLIHRQAMNQESNFAFGVSVAVA